MRKVLAFILAALMLFSLSAFAFADDEADTAVAETVSTEGPIVDKGTDKATPSEGELIHFIPTTIDVTSENVKVSGYFINLNSDVSVGNFEDFEMDVYRNGSYLVGGSFGKIHEFMIRPFSVKAHSFTFTGGDHGLTHGSYSCDDRCYSVINCTFYTN